MVFFCLFVFLSLQFEDSANIFFSLALSPFFFCESSLRTSPSSAADWNLHCKFDSVPECFLKSKPLLCLNNACVPSRRGAAAVAAGWSRSSEKGTRATRAARRDTHGGGWGGKKKINTVHSAPLCFRSEDVLSKLDANGFLPPWLLFCIFLFQCASDIIRLAPFLHEADKSYELKSRQLKALLSASLQSVFFFFSSFFLWVNLTECGHVSRGRWFSSDVEYPFCEKRSDVTRTDRLLRLEPWPWLDEVLNRIWRVTSRYWTIESRISNEWNDSQNLVRLDERRFG